jgi:hypothetical protein
MDLSKIVSGVLDVAEKLLPALEGTPAGAVVEAGKSVLDLIDQVREVVSTDDAAALQAKREALEPKVLAHLDRTIDSLD